MKTDIKTSVAKFIDAKAFLFSIIFTAVFILWESIFLRVPFIQYFFWTSQRFNIRYWAFLQFIVVASILLFIFYVYTVLVSSTIPKFFLLFIFCLVVVFEYGYFNALGRFTTVVDLEIALFVTNLEHKTGAIFSYINFLSIFPCLALGFLSFFYKTTISYTRKYIFVFPLVLMIVFYSAVGAYFKIHFWDADFPLLSFTNLFKEAVEIPPNWLFIANGEREKLEEIERKEPPKKNIIFVTDESVRADHLSIYDYSRETTPYLKELYKSGKLVKFDSCVSGTTCSTSSASLLLTGLQISDLPDKEFKSKRLPTLYQYAKAAGYKVHFFDAQMSHFWNSPYLDEKYVDVWKNYSDFIKTDGKETDVDFAVAKEVSKIINSSGGNFIWIWKRGVHFPYKNKYPEEETKWKPVSNLSYLQSISREEMANTYDNAIRYNLDSFFKNLVPAIENSENNVLIYTADHGQNLRENMKFGTHCKTTKNEANVPLFMLGNFEPKVNTDFKATHANIFATLLDLMEVPESMHKHKYADSFLDPKAVSPKHRYYWSLDITKGKKIKFD